MWHLPELVHPATIFAVGCTATREGIAVINSGLCRRRPRFPDCAEDFNFSLHASDGDAVVADPFRAERSTHRPVCVLCRMDTSGFVDETDGFHTRTQSS